MAMNDGDLNEVSKLLGDKVAKVLKEHDSQISRLQRDRDDIHGAWKEGDWGWLAKVGVVSKSLVHELNELERKQWMLHKGHGVGTHAEFPPRSQRNSGPDICEECEEGEAEYEVQTEKTTRDHPGSWVRLCEECHSDIEYEQSRREGMAEDAADARRERQREEREGR